MARFNLINGSIKRIKFFFDRLENLILSDRFKETCAPAFLLGDFSKPGK